jgi:hypothetical protein
MAIQSPDIEWYTNDIELYNDPEYQTVIHLIHDLWRSGIIEKGTGQCWAMTDVICKLLKINGIESFTQECSLFVMRKDPPHLNLIGYFNDPENSPGDIYTHIVCITKTKIPMLIDLSISNYDDKVRFICERVNGKDECQIAEYNLNNITYQYSKKDIHHVPELYQQNILSRIKTDNLIFSKIGAITKVLIGVSIVTSLNLARGSYDFYQKYINKTNGFGPVPQKNR